MEKLVMRSDNFLVYKIIYELSFLDIAALFHQVIVKYMNSEHPQALSTCSNTKAIEEVEAEVENFKSGGEV